MHKGSCQRRNGIIAVFFYPPCSQFTSFFGFLFLVVKLLQMMTNNDNQASKLPILSANNKSSHPNLLYGQAHQKLSVCGRQLPFPLLRLHDIGSVVATNKIVVIGHDTMNHVQTNNHINAIFHASDYATDIGARLVILGDSWAQRSLTMLFGNKELAATLESWNIYMIPDEIALGYRFPNHTFHYLFNKSDDMYYYHSSTSLDRIMARRSTMLGYLWSHPSHGQSDSKMFQDMCSVVRDLLKPNESYAVIHSRWMTKNGCLGRMGSLAARLRTVQSELIPSGVELDRKAPCLLTPSYIKSIIHRNMLYSKRIFIITDGKNPDIIRDLLQDEDIGSFVQTIPYNLSWVGGDMMLAVLADVFVGSPISTLAGNVARARVALGFNGSTNYLFPMKRRDYHSTWAFFCNNQCLYDPNILYSYVG